MLWWGKSLLWHSVLVAQFSLLWKLCLHVAAVRCGHRPQHTLPVQIAALSPISVQCRDCGTSESCVRVWAQHFTAHLSTFTQHSHRILLFRITVTLWADTLWPILSYFKILIETHGHFGTRLTNTTSWFLSCYALIHLITCNSMLFSKKLKPVALLGFHSLPKQFSLASFKALELRAAGGPSCAAFTSNLRFTQLSALLLKTAQMFFAFHFQQMSHWIYCNRHVMCSRIAN